MERCSRFSPLRGQPQPPGERAAAGAALRRFPAEPAVGGLWRAGRRLWPAALRPEQAAKLRHAGAGVQQFLSLSRRQLSAESALHGGRLQSQPPAERRQCRALQPGLGRFCGSCRRLHRRWKLRRTCVQRGCSSRVGKSLGRQCVLPGNCRAACRRSCGTCWQPAGKHAERSRYQRSSRREQQCICRGMLVHPHLCYFCEAAVKTSAFSLSCLHARRTQALVP